MEMWYWDGMRRYVTPTYHFDWIDFLTTSFCSIAGRMCRHRMYCESDDGQKKSLGAVRSYQSWQSS